MLRTVCGLLRSQDDLLVTFTLEGVSPQHVQAALDTARISADRLESVAGEQRALLAERIEIGEERITILLARRGWAAMLGTSCDAARDAEAPPTLTLPVRFAKRRVEQKIILGDRVARPVWRDEILLKAIARAHGWLDALKQQRFRDLSAIARAEKLPRTYVHALIRLAFLSPRIVTVIVEGRQPADLTLQHLITRTDLACDWAVQGRQLGFEA